MTETTITAYLDAMGRRVIKCKQPKSHPGSFTIRTTEQRRSGYSKDPKRHRQFRVDCWEYNKHGQEIGYDWYIINRATWLASSGKFDKYAAEFDAKFGANFAETPTPAVV